MVETYPYTYVGRIIALHLHFNYTVLQTFESLGLSEPLIKALSENNITVPTAIQQQAIPVLLDRATDFLGLAQTGTGKTAAFGLPLIEQIDPDQKFIQAVILSPTRELAQQIAKALGEFSKYLKGVSVDVVYGGTSISNQIKDLRQNKPNILVATPGRLIDLMNRKVLNLSNVSYLVLDEADEMLNMGFKEDIDTILSFTQRDKNTWLFSATMPKEIRSIVDRYMNNPEEVSIKSKEMVNVNIEHRYMLVQGRDKRAALARIIDAEGDMYCLIFCRTKLSTQSLANAMADIGYPVEALHGDMSQQQRNTVMRKFKAKSVKMVAATDVAARGIDVDNLTHVIHFDLPDDLSFYTHRSGRTGRAGNKGVAVSLITPREERKIRDLERDLKIKFVKAAVPSTEEVTASALQSKLDELLMLEDNQDARVWAESFAEQFEGITAVDLLTKVFTQQMTRMKRENKGDLNAKAQKGREGEGRDRGRRDSKRREGKSLRGNRQDRDERRTGGKRSMGSHEDNMDRFYVSIGRDDELEKSDVLKIVCDASGVRSKYIGRIQMYGKHTLVDVEKAKSGGFAQAFQGLRFNGRRLKVSLDNPS